MELCGVLKAQDDEDGDKTRKDVVEEEEGEEEEREQKEKEAKTREAAAGEQTDLRCTASIDLKSEMAP